MKIVRKAMLSLFAGFGVMFTLGLTAAPAQAQATRTWVSGVGDDVNPCSRTAPCKTFAGAISKTAAGGQINCIDPGSYGPVTITKSITIKCDPMQAGVLASGTNAIIINAPADARVVLQGLDIDGLSNGTSLSGVRVLSARDVIIIDSQIRGFNSAASGGISVDSGAVRVRVTVYNTSFVGNTTGIQVISAGGRGSAKVINSMLAKSSAASIRVSGTGNSATITGNAFYGSPKALELLAGGVADSFGNNAFGTVSTDAPTVTPLG